MPAPSRYAQRFIALLFAIAPVAACGAALPATDPHPAMGLRVAGERGWRLETDHVGEWIPVPAPGVVTVVDFWSSTCAPCIASIPELERLWRASDGTRVRYVGVSVDEEASDARRALEEKVAGPVTFPMVIDGRAARLGGAFRVGGSVPSTFVVDRDGVIRFYADGSEGDLARLDRIVRALSK
jgi:thiol-disulfide isomerase/thioredoxin